MKPISFLFPVALLLLPGMVLCQGGAMRILPEAGLSYPAGAFRDVNVFAKQGYQFGLHLDKMWGGFGLGLYGGIASNDAQYKDLLPENPGPDFSRLENITRPGWRQLSAGIGPVLQLNLSKQISVALTSKLGLAKLSYPDFSQLLRLGGTPPDTYTLFQNRNGDIAQKFNPILLSALRLNFKVAKGVDLSLAGNVRHVRNVLHAYSYLDGDFSPDMSSEALHQALQTAPTVAETKKCHFNSAGVTLGLTFQIGGRPEVDEKIAPPVPVYPEGGATISMEEVDSLALEWQKEMRPVGKASYTLWLWKVAEAGRGADSLVLQTNAGRKQQYALPENVRLEPGAHYRWRVRAVGDKELKACPEGCYSVEAAFKVGAGAAEQYYQLLIENSGNYIEVQNQLRVELPKNIDMMSKPIGRIFNQQHETVWEVSDLASGERGQNHTLDEHGRLTINISRLRAGYYFFELTTENKRVYYFRFQVIKSNESNRK